MTDRRSFESTGKPVGRVGDPGIASEAISNLVQDVTQLLELSHGQSELIAAALQSLLSAMSRVAPADRENLQALVAAFIEDPEDKEIKAKLGALLLAARQSDH